MVTAFLENFREEFIREKNQAEKKIRHLEIQLKENEKIQQMLREESEDINFEVFTPRVMHQEHQSRIHDLEKKNEELSLLIEEEQKNCCKYLKNIEELDAVIKSVSDADALWKEAEKKADQNMEEEEIFRIRLLETQENERQRISRELHDYTVQNLTSLIHRTELCSKLIDMDAVRCKLELNNMAKILREVICDTRKMIYNLHPMSFDDIGLDVAIERALDKLEVESEKKKIDFEVQGKAYPLKPVVGITILRIIQEACSNSICHANCTEIRVVLQYEENRITAFISDDGDGFDMNELTEKEKLDSNSGFGLAMMKERIYLLSGEIKIESEIGYGTEITVHVPVNKEELQPEK